MTLGEQEIKKGKRVEYLIGGAMFVSVFEDY